MPRLVAETPLTTDPALDQTGARSPNGRQLAFMSLRQGYCSIFLMNADESGQVNLTPKPAEDPAASWCSRAPSWSKRRNETLPGGLAIYGSRFGRYPLDPTVLFVLR